MPAVTAPQNRLASFLSRSAIFCPEAWDRSVLRCREIEHLLEKRLVIKTLTPASQLARGLIACRPVPPQGGDFLRGRKTSL
jgi:hypothetical protein